MIKAIAQPTKQGWVYVFDRATGQPVWPIEERPVEKGDVPGEWYSPTQPFVTKPPPFERQGVYGRRPDRLHAGAARRGDASIASRYKMGPIFTPPIVSTWPGPLATLMLPDVTGGANWQGGSLDPETNIFYIFSNTSVSALGLVPGDPSANSDFALRPGHRARSECAAPAPAGGAGGRGVVRPGQRRRRHSPGGGRGVAPARVRRRPVAWRRRRWGGGEGGGGLTRSGPAARQAAVRAHHGARPEQGRAGVADRPRRNARTTSRTIRR